MAQLLKEMPCHYRLKERINELNKKWNIRPTPGGTIGIQQSLKERLTTCTKHMIRESSADAEFKISKKLRVKLTGDGMNIGKRLHVVNFGFALLDEGDKAYSSEGNHCLAIFKEPESYDCLKLCLSDIIDEAKNLSTITVDSTTFSLEYYLGGDWKFLALATGIDSASSDHACIWCKCPALERHSSALKCSISNPDLGAHTIEENVQIAQSKKKQFNVSRLPLFPTIPLTCVVVDNLHVFLSVADTLIDLFITKLRQLDRIDWVNKLHSLDRSKLTHIASFEKVVKEMGFLDTLFGSVVSQKS